jgi:hypothetical protein
MVKKVHGAKKVENHWFKVRTTIEQYGASEYVLLKHPTPNFADLPIGWR